MHIVDTGDDTFIDTNDDIAGLDAGDIRDAVASHFDHLNDVIGE